MNSEQPAVLTTTDVQPPKSGVRTGYNQINGYISQIPGLSSTIGTLPEEKARGRRVGVRETDSDYIKLAKQGGHKGLLWHQESTSSKPTSYKPPDWFCSTSEDSREPSEEKKNPGAFQPLKPPFGTDVSALQRDHLSSNGKQKDNIHVDGSQMEKLQTSSQYQEANKFKRIVFDKKPASVDMSKLLSFGYVEDTKPPQ
ncbi:uncharacterized protein C7orf57-like [Brachyistius frenatus]|uniref:uncharacterized protein C7orf57-like n=1 Tax=Brachyistius frenatus TaxID=100188 RepID=UPI0037E9151A